MQCKKTCLDTEIFALDIKQHMFAQKRNIRGRVFYIFVLYLRAIKQRERKEAY